MRKKINIYLATMSQELQEAMTRVQALTLQCNSQITGDRLNISLELSAFSYKVETTKMPTCQSAAKIKWDNAYKRYFTNCDTINKC